MSQQGLSLKSGSFNGCVAVAWMGLNWWAGDKRLGMLEAVGEASLRPNINGTPSTSTAIFSPLLRVQR